MNPSRKQEIIDNKLHGVMIRYFIKLENDKLFHVTIVEVCKWVHSPEEDLETSKQIHKGLRQQGYKEIEDLRANFVVTPENVLAELEDGFHRFDRQITPIEYIEAKTNFSFSLKEIKDEEYIGEFVKNDNKTTDNQ